MENELNIERFREVRSLAEQIIQLRTEAAIVLKRRPLRSFDGFGHFLDAVLGENQERLAALSRAVHLESTTIDQLRASELDPLAGPFEQFAYLGFLIGIEGDDFSRLVCIDHGRFAQHSDAVFARSGDGVESDAVERTRQLWARFEEDLASEL